jgi:hypothetical protein
MDLTARRSREGRRGSVQARGAHGPLSGCWIVSSLDRCGSGPAESGSASVVPGIGVGSLRGLEAARWTDDMLFSFSLQSA